ncbi:neuraminidase-like domain-containing protein [Sphingomonas qilianensis]|uniref:Neuraminidase-like domain-containing protein n=1 Tax=Sphingomonas qilianensis TaxID=1736690 RepID=A0ABU9XSG5_9SPHN
MDVDELAAVVPELAAFARDRPDFDILRHDFLADVGPGDSDAPLKASDPLRDVLMECQRLARIAPSGAVLGALRQLGFGSAAEVAALEEGHFVAISADALGGDTGLAGVIHSRARAIKGQAIHLWANAAVLAKSPLLRHSPVSSVGTAPGEVFSGLPSYQALFGNQDYCACPHCQSIFGPAAYFVDLMRLTQRYVTDPNRATIPPDLTLEQRRPQLFTDALSCAATNDLVPHLVIANGVLADWVEKLLHTDAPERFLATANYPLNLPRNLPLVETRLLLASAGLSLPQVYTAFEPAAFTTHVSAATPASITLAEAPPGDATMVGAVLRIVAGPGTGQARQITAYDVQTRIATVGAAWAVAATADSLCVVAWQAWPVAREALGLSLEQAALVATPVVDPAALEALYGLPGGTGLAALAQVPMFLRHTDFDPVTLRTLLFEDFDDSEIAAGLAHGLFINGALGSGGYVALVTGDLGVETLAPLDAPTLDRIGRFVRLARWTGLSFADLDWLIAAAGETQISEGTLIEIADALQAKALTGLPLDTLTALWADMKTIGRGDGEQPADLFDRVWNPISLLADGGVYRPLYPANPLFVDAVVTWDVATGVTTGDGGGGFGRSRLVAGLRVSDAELTAIGQLLFGEAAVPLDVGNLTLLYRTTVLLRLTQLDVAGYEALLLRLGLSPTAPILPLELSRLVAAARWMSAARLSSETLSFVLADVVPPLPTAPDSRYAQMRALWLLARPGYVTPRSFIADTITPDQSAAAYAVLVAQTAPARVRSLGADYARVFGPGQDDIAMVLAEVTTNDLAFLATDLGFSARQIDVVVDAVNAAFVAQGEMLANQLAAMLGAGVEMVDAASLYIATAIGTPTALLTTLLVPLPAPTGDDPGWQAIENVFARYTRLLVAAATLQIDAPTLAALPQMPAVFGIANLARPTLDDLRCISAYNALVAASDNSGDAWLAYFGMPAATNAEQQAKLTCLAALTYWPEAQILAILDQIGATIALIDTVAGITRLSPIFALFAAGGFDPGFAARLLALRTLPADGPDASHANWETYRDTAAATHGTIAGKLGAAWDQSYATIVSQMNVARRDALEPIVVWQLGRVHPWIVDRRQLYGFLLIDVDMSGCAMTSRVAEAIGAVQLYLQRCRLNLEPGVDQLRVPEAQWQWMNNYRVWEANRRIFLYPENYMEPTLRSSRTEVFKELEESLLQTNVTDETVTKAYGTYFERLDALATLIYVDSLRCIVDDRKRAPVETLFVFARTLAEPYEFYVARQELGAVWSEWRRIDASIPAPFITPAYAFGRLFVFWVELKVVREIKIRADPLVGSMSENSSTYTASIHFTFQTSTGGWSPAQSLIDNEVVYVTTAEPPFNSESGYGLFDMDALFWRKCSALTVPGERLLAPPLATGRDEKIVIFYGPFLENDQDPPSALKVGPRPDPAMRAQDPARYVFDLNVYTRSGMINQAIASTARGDIALQSARVLNRDLHLDFLMRGSEFRLLLESRSPGVPPAIKPVIDVATSALYVGDTFNVLRSNYYGDWTSPIQSATQAIRATADAFVVDGLDAARSQGVYDDLLGHGVIDHLGVIEPIFTTDTNLDFLFGGEQFHNRAILVAEIQNILLNLKARGLPVQGDSFLLTAIDAPLAAQVLIDLRGNGVLDGADRVDPAFSSRTDLSFLFGGAPPEEQARLIYEVQRVLFRLMADPLLLGSISRRNAATIVTKNQPDWFLINAGNEAFKVVVTDMQLPMLSANMRVKEVPSAHIISADSFIMTDIDSALSMQAYEDLVGHGVVDANGQLEIGFGPSTDLSFLFANAPLRERMIMSAEVRAVLLNLPTITALSYFHEDENTVFTAAALLPLGIGQAAADAALAALVVHAVVSAIGGVSRSYGPDTDLSYLYADTGDRRALLIAGTRAILRRFFATTWQRAIQDVRFAFERLTTAAVPRLNASLASGGVEALLALTSQQAPVVPLVPFSAYLPTRKVIEPKLFDGAQVDFDGPYGLYYWELFYFTPELVAATLMRSGRHDAAIAWLQYIFNPTVRPDPLIPADFITADIDEADAESGYAALCAQGIILPDGMVAAGFGTQTDLSFLFPAVADPLTRQQMIREVRNVLTNALMAAPTSRFWRFMPFRNQTLAGLVETLTDPVTIALYENDPFDPYAIARMRIGAFEKATVMRYLDVLIDWGDALYAQKTREALTAATMLYLYADELLGARPVDEGPCKIEQPASYAQIAARYADVPGGIPPFLIELENVVSGDQAAASPELLGQPFNDVEALFCVPENEKMLAYWDRLADRLFKLRNCLDLEGNSLDLPLFAPPIDALALVRAAAAGTSGLTANPQGQAAVPSYRYSFLMMQARTIVSSAAILGSALSNALAERDNETLFRLRASQELAILNLTTRMKTLQVDEARAGLAALEQSRAAIQSRQNFYAGLIREFMSPGEIANIALSGTALLTSIGAGIAQTVAAIAYAVPQVGAPTAMTYGGIQLGNSASKWAAALESATKVLEFGAQTSLTVAGYQRRAQDWQREIDQSVFDLAQTEAQILAAQTQIAGATRDLEIHQRTIAQAQDYSDFLLRKFDNYELFAWMAGRLSSLFYQTYRAALEATLAAQAAYQYELNSDDVFVNFASWDERHSGLLSGETLNMALDQMDQAYVRSNTRRLEITKTVSLAQIAPTELLRLRSEGRCTIDLSEALYDFDFPGQYCRRIKTAEFSLVSTIEAESGFEIHATILQTRNQILVRADKAGLDYMLGGGGDQPLSVRSNWQANQVIAASASSLGSGLWELILGIDDRLYPFEGTGAVCSFDMAMPLATNRFDFSTIEDVAVTLRYSALDGGPIFRKQVETALAGPVFAGTAFLSLATAFEADWAAFMEDHGDPVAQVLTVEIDRTRLVPNLSDYLLDSVDLWITVDPDDPLPGASTFLTLAPAKLAAASVPFKGAVGLYDANAAPLAQFAGSWAITVDLEAMKQVPELAALLSAGFLDPARFLDVGLVLNYRATVFKS